MTPKSFYATCIQWMPVVDNLAKESRRVGLFPAMFANLVGPREVTVPVQLKIDWRERVLHIPQEEQLHHI